MAGGSTVLVVDDEERIRRILQAALGERGHQVVTAAGGKEAIARLDGQIDLLLTDLRMPDVDGLELLRHVRRSGLSIPVIVMTAFGTVDSAVEAMKQGAYDYVAKPFDLDDLELTIERALEADALARENRFLRESEQAGLEDLLGASTPMLELFDRIRRVAPTDASVLVSGETGSGKELVARAIHTLSGRKDRLFVAVNCAAIPRDLLESELFGHVKGAFTGATQDRPGKFEFAHQGTLFLDEIIDMPIELQAKMLRVLEDRRVTRLGSNREVAVDVRVVAASNRDIAKAIQAERFREDLYYRLNVIQLRIPPLRERRDDIPLLAEHFLRESARRIGRSPLEVEPDALELLRGYPWPGNVRELKNVCERLTVLSDRDAASAELVAHLLDLPAGGDAPAAGGSLAEAVGRAEVEAIRRALAAAGGNKARAARSLGISERTLWYKLKKYAESFGSDLARDA